MKISAIVPLYNTQGYVAEAIDSILAQTRLPDEIVVVDDGSTDGGPELLERYGSAVRVLKQAHLGPSAALNKGIAETTGDIIAFLDADDLWDPRKLELQSEVLLQRPDIHGVFGLIQLFGATAPSQPQRGVSRNGLLIRRSAFESFGLFDETLRASDFVPWYSRAHALGLKTDMVSHVVAYRRIHTANTGLLRRTEQQQDNLAGLKRALDLRRGRGQAAPARKQRDSQDQE